MDIRGSPDQEVILHRITGKLISSRKHFSLKSILSYICIEIRIGCKHQSCLRPYDNDDVR